MSDTIYTPEHYTVGGIETIDFLRSKSSKYGFQEFCRLSAMQYLSRAPYKGHYDEDMKKAGVYIKWAVEHDGQVPGGQGR